MEKSTKNAGILGIGNLLLSDESFGVHVVDFLDEHYIFPESVTVLDGGTSGIYMAPFLEDHDPIFVVDVVNFDDATPGSLCTFSVEDIRNGVMQPKMSPHQLGILEILDICKLRGIEPECVDFYCVVPSSLATGLAMTDVVAGQVEKVAGIIVKRLWKQGHAIFLKEKKNP